MRLTEKTTASGSYIYQSSRLFRGLCLAFFFLLALGMVGVLGTEGWSLSFLAPLCVMLCSLAGALYIERWTFSPQDNRIISSFGIWPFVSNTSIACADVTCVVVLCGSAGQPAGSTLPTRRRLGHTPMVSLHLETKGEPLTVEVISERVSGGRTEAVGRKIASVCGLPFEMDRPYDAEIKTTLRDL